MRREIRSVFRCDGRFEERVCGRHVGRETTVELVPRAASHSKGDGVVRRYVHSPSRRRCRITSRKEKRRKCHLATVTGSGSAMTLQVFARNIHKYYYFRSAIKNSGYVLQRPSIVSYNNIDIILCS